MTAEAAVLVTGDSGGRVEGPRLAAPGARGVDQPAGGGDHEVRPVDLDHVAGARRHLEADRSPATATRRPR